VSRRRAGNRRDAMADDLARGAARRTVRPGDGDHARHRARDRRDDGRDDGHRQRRVRARTRPGHAAQPGPHHDRDHRGGNGRSGAGQPALQRAGGERHRPVRDHLRDQHAPRAAGRRDGAPERGKRMTRQHTQKIAVALITASAVLVVIPIIAVIAYIVVQGAGAISWEFLTARPRNGMTEGGIMPAILGTLILTLGTSIRCSPLAVGAATYLAESATDSRRTRGAGLALVSLAGIPSVVYGLCGLAAFVLLMQFGTSILAGSLTLGIMTLPVVISTAEE